MSEIARLPNWKRHPERPEDYDGSLVELPDGSWIDPADITEVTPLDAVLVEGIGSNAKDHDHMPRVVVARGERRVQIECTDFDSAKSLANWFADLTNAARKLARRSSGGPVMR